MIGLSGLAVAAAVIVWVIVVGFRSQRWSVWSVAIFSAAAYWAWKPAIENGYAEFAFWMAVALCIAGIVAIVMLLRKART